MIEENEEHLERISQPYPSSYMVSTQEALSPQRLYQFGTFK
jgi:hypothetical protein